MYPRASISARHKFSVTADATATRLVALQKSTSNGVQDSREATMAMGMVRVLGPRLTRVITGDIPATAAAKRIGVVAMSRMRMIDAMGVPGAFAARYHASRKVPCASPA